MKILGFEIFKDKTTKEDVQATNLSTHDLADSSVVVSRQEGVDGGIAAHLNLFDGVVPQEERQAIIKYREMSLESEIDFAIQQIRNEIFVLDEPGKKAFGIVFNDGDGSPSDNIRKKIIKEANEVYEVIDFQNKGLQLFSDFYVDGRYYWHILIDEKNPRAGIKGILPLDPLETRRVKIRPKKNKDGTFNIADVKDVFIHAKNIADMHKKFSSMNSFSQIELEHDELDYGKVHQFRPDSIVYVTSGLVNRNSKFIVGYLHKAIAHYNRLKMAEDSMLIFRIVRAPSRRAFYIDVSGMTTPKANEYMKKQMQAFKQKMFFDNKTGTVSGQTNIQSMLEDYWLPRRDGSKGTEIQTIDGQSSQDMLDEVQYFRKNLYRALNIPMSRFGENEATFVFGNTQQINFDSYSFNKYLATLRNQFMQGFRQLLKTQLVLKKIITEKEWDLIDRFIYFDFLEDNNFVQMKEMEALKSQVDILSQVQPYIGKYYSHQFVRNRVLRQTEEEQNIIDAQIEEWKKTHGPEPTDENE